MDREGLRDGGRARRLARSSASASASTRTATSSTATRACHAGREQWTVRGSRRLSDEPDVARRRADPLRGARALPAGAVLVRTQRRGAGGLRVDVRGGRAARARSARDRSRAAARLPPRRRRAALPPDRRRRPAGSRSTARATRSRPTRGSRRATTRGACARASALPPADLEGGVPVGAVVPVLVEPDAPRARRRHRATRCTTSTASSAFGGYEESSVEGGVEHADGRVERVRRAPPRRCASTRSTGASSAGRCTSRPPTAPSGRSPSRRSATPASTSAPASTSGSTATSTASGAASSHVDGEHFADCTDRATARAHPPDPRRDRARRRPGRRRPRLGQPADDDHRRVARRGPRRGVVVRLRPRRRSEHRFAVLVDPSSRAARGLAVTFSTVQHALGASAPEHVLQLEVVRSSIDQVAHVDRPPVSVAARRGDPASRGPQLGDEIRVGGRELSSPRLAATFSIVQHAPGASTPSSPSNLAVVRWSIAR